MKPPTGKHLLLRWFGLGLIWLVSYILLKTLVSEVDFDAVQLVFSRIAMLVVLAATAMLLWQQLPGMLRHPPHQSWIGVFRIAFCGLTGIGSMIHPSFHRDHLSFFETTPGSLSDSPLLFLVNPTAMEIALWVMGVSGVIAMAGWQTKKALFVFFLSSFYVFGSVNLYGKINHHHHLFWFPLILLFSNCHRFYSIDEWWRRRSGIDLPWRPDYGLVLLWMTIGIMYFFPGFWKVWRTGIDWMFSDAVLNQFYLKWRAEDWLPVFRMDHYPLAVKAGALMTVLFELSFITLIFHHTTRIVAIVAGTLFHLITWVFLDILFFHLIIAYIALLPTRSRERPAFIPLPKRNANALKLVMGLFIGGNILAGFAHHDGHFFTCYPTFSYTVTDTQPGLVLTRNDVPVPLSELKKHFPNERFQYWEYQVIKMHENGEKRAYEQKLNALLSPYRNEIGPEDTLRVYSIETPLAPDAPPVYPSPKDTAIYQDPR